MQFTLDQTGPRRALEKHWEFCVGSCHAATALRADWQAQLARCQRELGFRYVRFHGLFNDDMSAARKKPFTGEIVFSFTNIDKILDFLLSIGMKPFLELSFMPTCFAGGASTIFHYRGNTSPPADHAQWAGFIGAFVRHLLARYGRGEVRQWFFEVWNEPNLGGPGSPFGFWNGTREEYFALYKTTAEAIKAEDPFLRVGGPATSNNAWVPEMVEFCEEGGVPLDFISTHHYPTDVVLGYGVEDSANFEKPPIDINDGEALARLLADPAALQKAVAEYTVFKKDLWKQVDRGVLTAMARRVAQEAKGLPVYFTEWGSLGGLPSDGPFGASFIAKTVLDNVGLVQGYSFWTFSDIFEEDGQQSAAFHGGFGLLTTQGIPKAPYRAFQLLHGLGGEMYEARFSEGTVDVYAFSKPEAGAVQFLCVNHHSLLHPIEEQTLTLALAGGQRPVAAEVTRIDETHANPLAAWQQMGGPEYLTEAQVLQLQAASVLQAEPLEIDHTGAGPAVGLTLPPMGIALVSFYL